MGLKEAAQQALEALRLSDPKPRPGDDDYAEHGWEEHNAAVYALRAALAEDAMQRLTDEQQMIERGTKAWAGVPDATAWVEEIRGNEPATSQESRQVEPVAYVTGYNKGRCIIEAVDPAWLLPVGMALYRSPPTISKTETVEPVGEIILQDTKYHGRAMAVKPCGKNGVLPEGIKLYTAPPKRKPLTENQIRRIDDDTPFHEGPDWAVRFTRAIEQAHGIGGEE